MGLAARAIEAAGVATGVLSWIPETTESVGAPRVLGIGYPGSVPFGVPGDAVGQSAVLAAALEATVAMREPGGRIDPPFEWPARRRVPKPAVPPPITRAIYKRPWLYLKLLKGDIP